MVRFAVRKFELIYNFELYHEPFEFKYNAVVVQKICCLFFYNLNDGKKTNSISKLTKILHITLEGIRVVGKGSLKEREVGKF